MLGQPCLNTVDSVSWYYELTVVSRSSLQKKRFCRADLFATPTWTVHSFPVWFWFGFVGLVFFPLYLTSGPKLYLSWLQLHWSVCLYAPSLSLGVLCFSSGSGLCATWNLPLCLLQTKQTWFLYVWSETANICQSQQDSGGRNVWPSSVKFSRLKSPDIKIDFICLSKCYCSKLNNDVLLEGEEIG